MDFKKITDALLSGGQNRRQWLNKKADDLQQGMEYYLGPTGIPDKVQSLGQLLQYSDAGDFVEAGDASRELWNNPSIENAARYATAGAALAVPFVGAKMANDGVDVLGDALRSGTDDIKKFAKGEDGAIKAYHGSPHDFDKFSMDKIGTGEGAQAYGHGLYFAESEDVARSYRDTLERATVNGQSIEIMNISPASKELIDLASRDGAKTTSEVIDWAMQARDGLPFSSQRAIDEAISEIKKSNGAVSRGSMYEVNIDANPDDFLDWDAPLSAQSPKVRALAEQTGVADVTPEWRFNGYDGGYFRKTENGSRKVGEVRHLGGNTYRARVGKDDLGEFSSPEQARSAIDRALDARGGASEVLKMRGQDIYSRLAGGVDSLVNEPKNRAGATAEMQEAGIPGIKYKDAGSRGLDGESGTRNYVVFDENLISIVKKYGIAGAAAMLGVNASDVQGAMAQGQPDTMGNILSPNAKRQPVMRDYLNQ